MPAIEPKATKRYTILNTRENITQQIKDAQETKKPIVLEIESEVGNQSELTIFFRLYMPSETREDLLFAMSERKEDVTVRIPKNTKEPAIAILPN